MGQKKLERFAEIKTFENVLEYPKDMQGKWHEFFKNEHSITLELACGKGEYAVGLGRLYPERNFIGVDIKGNRIWRGAKNALTENLSNVAFLRSQIEIVNDYFSKNEVSEIWLTFPDPHLPNVKWKKRLTSPRFLRLYQQFLKKDGIIHLKTDSPVLYKFTKAVTEIFGLEIVKDDDNVYKNLQVSPELSIKTFYESLDIAGFRKVHYLAFKLNNDLPSEKDELVKKFVFEFAKDEKNSKR
ncbi:tRNA (guanosine(46)-N7)-methyltransferase TrmB [Arachidicoccus ginsenosidimutans]|uniref:tRNA (guanosine(46)-N7)-methyltransferase TrmB n=1 Tax=Arachidicoccus sp. BS20 TaxID=1850526 RepID=UPI0007F0DDFE|nr:tRNA (guanosine(46)-N7)-methyltransferase TrmB [Arachidicoccus sp. BS20]ANI89681.1 tRNA (guanosine(46)-N7)-methyltransferase TrmB [Arachidicoccus sp. BS20]